MRICGRGLPTHQIRWKSGKLFVDYLARQDAYTLHKPIRRRFARRRTYSKGIADLYQIDLADLSYLSTYNDGYRYLLNCIDVVPTSDYVKRFDGVFAGDRLPTKPRLLVCNTDPSDMPREHWIAIYVDDDGHYGEYFDSLGRAPDRLYIFEHYMNEHCREWTYNCKHLQSITSRFCGHYCVCFCIRRSTGIDMRRFYAILLEILD